MVVFYRTGVRMTQFDDIKKNEQNYLDQVESKIDTAISETILEVKSAGKQVDDLQKNWGDIRVKDSTYSGMMETAMSVRTQRQMLEQREQSRNSAEHHLDVLQKQKARPYFARIDFEDQIEDEKETIYIGLASFSDNNDHFLVYDWRAPIASIYYDAGIGEVKYDTPDGVQTADVKLKRQFQIEEGVIVTIFDTDEAVGDQLLLNALSSDSSTKMKSIVTTIQKEQNKIIRDTDADLLFVQGSAGSGKTSVVLQRIAFLLYRYRGKLTSGQVVMFSPNQLFNDYIDQVLPELGEQNMIQLTFHQYASRRLPNMKVETLAERFEDDNDTQAKKLIELKSSLDFFNAVTKYSDSLNYKGIQFKSINFGDEVLFSKEKIAEIYYGYNDNYNLGQRLEATKESLIKSLNGKIGSEIKSEWVEEALQNLTKEEIDNLLGNEVKEFSSDKQEQQFLAKTIVTNSFEPIAKKIRRNGFINMNAQLVHFSKQLPNFVDLSKYGLIDEEWQENVNQLIDQIKNKKMSLEDTTIYLYLFDLVTGKRGERDIRFVFIDEVQDYSTFQLAFLKFSFPRAKFTLLGDLNQAIFTKIKADNMQKHLMNLFDAKTSKTIRLTKTYRSTQQITDFTKEILTDSQNIEAFNRDGQLPNVILAKDQNIQFTNLLDQLNSNNLDGESTAIITKNLNQAKELYKKIKTTNLKVTLIENENQRLATGNIIIPSYLAKGLEFDAVIVWNADDNNYSEDSDRLLLYTVASRAMHKLTVLAADKLTPLLDKVPSNLYLTEKIDGQSKTA